MKRKILLLLLIYISFSLLSGCFLYDSSVGNNIGPFIDPMNNNSEDFLPDTNAEKVLVLDIEDEDEVVPEEPDEDDGIYIIDENTVRQTKPNIVEVNEDGQMNYYYRGDTFTFQIPFLWRTTMEVDIVTETDEDTDIVFYTFYYVPEDQPSGNIQRAQVMSIRVVPYSYYQRNGHGSNGYVATERVNSADGLVYTYYAPTDDQKLSGNFPKLDDYSTIIKVLTSNWNFQHIDEE